MTEDWLTIQEAAAYLKLSVAAIRKYIRLGKLVSYHQGRIIRLKRNDLDAFMEAGRQGSK